MRSRRTTQAQRLRRRGAPAAERRLGAKVAGAAGVTRRSSSLQRLVRRRLRWRTRWAKGCRAAELAQSCGRHASRGGKAHRTSGVLGTSRWAGRHSRRGGVHGHRTRVPNLGAGQRPPCRERCAKESEKCWPQDDASLPREKCGVAERPQAQRLRRAARWLRAKAAGGRMGEGGGMVGSSQRDARSSSLQRMVRRCGRWEKASRNLRPKW